MMKRSELFIHVDLPISQLFYYRTPFLSTMNFADFINFWDFHEKIVSPKIIMKYIITWIVDWREDYLFSDIGHEGSQDPTHI